ncbi:hypothetical protein BHE90_003532 [Fusarium euwallaceae]|uniref:Uncharacterized protein n=1 Tax=Fusarium euwallaceae TaxID=1147111 RepID=A0A430M1U1_9HYPO|nr:hypothetical protein BHE90_003532 [Fusarium euwallaceae]
MNPLKDLKPGQAQLLSYFKPGLLPGHYTVDVLQPVTSPSADDPGCTLQTTKTLHVEGLNPYQLPTGSLHSFYPAQGETVGSRILPHLVLSDPHVPWELNPDQDDVSNTSLGGAPIPWFALLVFTAHELDTLPPASPALTPSPTLAAQLSKKQLQTFKTASSSPKVQVPLSDEELSKNPDDMLSVIFVNSAAFRAYFATQTLGTEGHEPQVQPDISRFSYLSHVRRTRSTKANQTSTDSYSITVCHRSGPLGGTGSTTAYVHLVSLKGVRNNLSYPVAGSSDLTALVSLLSWTFSWIPDTEAQIEDMIQNLSKNVRPLARECPALPSNPDMQSQWVQRRLQAGYTFIKHHMPSGETTAALFRGPLIPQSSPPDEIQNARATNIGPGLEIIDATTGFIDISYSAAWNLGSSLAIQKSAFAAALSTLRTRLLLIYRQLQPPVAADPLDEASQKLPDWIKQLGQITEAVEQTTNTAASGTGSRWKTARDKLDSSTPQVEIPAVNPEAGLHAVREMLDDEVTKLIEEKAQVAGNPEAPSKEGMFLPKIIDFVYNELLTLQAVPQNYLFLEPDILDTEAIFTFYLDPLWLDALIDGALSVGNQSIVNDDVFKKEIKRAINRYISHFESKPWTGRIPVWGTVICSKLLQSITDPLIRTSSDETAPTPQLLATTKLTDEALLLLFNCRPGDLTEGLTISQPPHQQRFAAGTTLTATSIEIDFPPVPMDNAADPSHKFSITPIKDDTKSQIHISNAFNFTTRCLWPARVMQLYMSGATAASADQDGEFPTMGSSSFMSLALGDKILELTINPTTAQVDSGRTSPLQPFQLHVPDTTTVASAATSNPVVENMMVMGEFPAPQTLQLSGGTMQLGYKVGLVTSVTIRESDQQTKGVLDVPLLRGTSSSTLGPVETTCRVLSQYKHTEGGSAADLLISIRAREDASNDKSDLLLQRVRIAFPLTALIATDAPTQPSVTLLGSEAGTWSAGSAIVPVWPPEGTQLAKDVASSGPAFVVELMAWCATLAAKADVSFMLSRVVLSSNYKKDVLLDVLEEYAVEDAQRIEATLVTQTWSVEGLE